MKQHQKQLKKTATPSGYYGLSVEMLTQMLKHTAVMCRVAIPPNEEFTDSTGYRKLEIFTKGTFDEKAREKSAKATQTNYLIQKDNHVLAMCCNEKLQKAAAIVHENAEKLRMSRQNMNHTTEMMDDTEKELAMYETILGISEKDKLLRPSDSADIQNAQGFTESNGRSQSAIFRRDGVSYENIEPPTFDEMTVDELIHLYWQVDESTSNEPGFTDSVAQAVHSPPAIFGRDKVSYENEFNPHDSEFEFKLEFEF